MKTQVANRVTAVNQFDQGQVAKLSYDPREMLVEKCRALLTRQAPKIRDILDLYLLEKELRLRYVDFEREIVRKTLFFLKMYEKYRKNLQRTKSELGQMLAEDESRILIRQLDGAEFSRFRKDAIRWMGRLSDKLIAEMERTDPHL